MPKKLWSFVINDDLLHVQVNKEIVKHVGPVLKVKKTTEKPNSIKVQFLDADAPKLLLLDNLSWDDNELSRHFQSCKDPQGFMRVWDEQISPFLDNSTGRFQRTGEQEKNSHQNVSKVTTPSTSGKKRARTPKSPPTLVPASKYAHLEDNSDDSEFEEGDMDEKITQYFLGK